MSQKPSAAATDTNKNVTITDNASGKEATFPIFTGTDGPPVIDIRRLYAETGYFTYDPGFIATGSCESKITYIDGDNGILLHRGYPIEQLAEKSDFLETSYLLLYGDLPNKKEKTSFDKLRTLEEKEGFDEKGLGKYFFRSGKKGTWKNQLDVNLSRKIRSKFKKEMDELNYI